MNLWYFLYGAHIICDVIVELILDFLNNGVLNWTISFDTDLWWRHMACEILPHLLQCKDFIRRDVAG